MEIRRGDVIYLKRLDSDPMRLRPYVVVSNDVGNHFSDISLVVPLTSKHKKLDMPTHAVLDYHGSMLLAEQIHTINQDDVDRIAHHLGKVDIDKIDRCVRASLGL